MRWFIVAAAVLLIAGWVGAQPAPAILWQQTYGGAGDESLDRIIQLPDGGFIVGGDFTPENSYGRDFWLFRINAAGETLWSHIYPRAGNDAFEEADQTPDGGYILAGTTTRDDGGEAVFLVKTNGDGIQQWTKVIGNSGSDHGTWVGTCPDGGFFITGYSNNEDTGQDALAIKTDAAGNVVWSRNYGGGGSEWAIEGAILDDGYMLAGYTTSTGHGSRDVYIVKLDLNGDVLWTRTFGGVESDFAETIQKTHDNGFIVAGCTSSSGQGWSDVYLLKLNGDGDLLWSRTFGTPSPDACMEIRQTADDGYFLAGITGMSPYDGWMIRTNALGEQLWNRVLPGTGGEWLLDCAVTSDGGYAAVGWTSSSGHGGQDGWIVRVAPDGPPPVEHYFTPVAATGLPYAIVIDHATVDGANLTSGDEIGIFDGNLCVGAGVCGSWPLTITAWQGDSLQGLTGFVAGHPMEFRIWQREPNIDLNAAAQFTIGDGTFGAGIYSRLSLESIATVTRILPLRAGYAELISFNQRIIEPTAAHVFGSIGSLIAAYQDNGHVFIPPNINTIGELPPTAAFRLFCTQAETLRVSGIPQNPNLEYHLAADQWNWISYPLSNESPVSEAFAAILEQVIIVQNDAGEVWIPSLGINTLGNLVPGKGYMIIVNAPTTFRLPAASATISIPPIRRSLVTLDDGPRPSGLPYTIVLHLDASIRSLNPRTVSIYDGNVCVGKAILPAASGLVTLPAWQSIPTCDVNGFTVGHSIEVTIENASGEIIPTRISGNHMTFGSGAFAEISATTGAAIPTGFRVGESYPNPFNPSTALDFSIDQAGAVAFRIYNALGQTVYEIQQDYSAGSHRFVFDTSILAHDSGTGVYFIRLQYHGQVETRKVMLLR